ncbi:hypothetical protein N7548_02885 [Acholeplasma manati]|uniref:Uncharacterized protein n=1 Tax=Paracholeplasma manati TaxID=591373 RepID=A0ABT2Y702_9MOLU|nr:hypothetical protein [Paracholeplasma manati]MCV2231765.1 hypothetical protein [Paracholeplasma manati]
MKRQYLILSYIFNDHFERIPYFAYDFLTQLNITKNIVITYFRLPTEKLSLNEFDPKSYKLYMNKKLTDNIILYFPSLEPLSKMNKMFYVDYHLDQTEIYFENINCSFDYYIENIIKANRKKSSIRKCTNLSVFVDEGMIIIKLNRDFYEKDKQQFNQLIYNWEHTFIDLKIRKSIK